MSGKFGRALGGAASGAAAGTAIAPGIGTAIGGLIGGIGGLFGGGDDDEERAKQLQADALEQIKNLKLPDIKDLQLQLEDLKAQGKISPEMQETILQQASELHNVKTDPRLKDAQMGALDKLQKISSEGLTPEDRMRINSVRRTISGDTHARDEAILQQMAQRGAAGSGNELAARMIASQGAADRASQQGDQIASDSNKAALQALMNSGTLGGQIRNQDFDEKSKIASAQDVINRFNAANRQNISSSNTGLRNNAQTANLTEAQRLADSNVGTHNYQQKFNKNLIVDDYNRQFDKAKAQSGADMTAAKQAQDAADRANNSVTGTLAGLGAAGTSIGQMLGKSPAPSTGGLDKGTVVLGDSKSGGMNWTPQQMPSNRAANAAHGDLVPGKAKVAGDSVQNDVVPYNLSPGEVVVPKSIVESSDNAVLDFVKAIKKHKRD